MLPGFTEFHPVAAGFKWDSSQIRKHVQKKNRRRVSFYWVLLGFIGLYQVLLGFTGFYWVLLGLTGF